MCSLLLAHFYLPKTNWMVYTRNVMGSFYGFDNRLFYVVNYVHYCCILVHVVVLQVRLSRHFVFVDLQ